MTKDAPAVITSVLKSATAAAQCCDFLLELSPLQKDGSRYMADFGFAMVSFCCLYIIRAYEMFGGTQSTLATALDSVKQVASLMEGLSVGSNHCPAMYGHWLLARLERAIPQKLISNDSVFTDSPMPPQPNLSSPNQPQSNSMTPVASSELPCPPGPDISLQQQAVNLEFGARPYYSAEPAALAGQSEPELFYEQMLESDFVFDPYWNLSTFTPF
jgi:hypothetical protein